MTTVHLPVTASELRRCVNELESCEVNRTKATSPMCWCWAAGLIATPVAFFLRCKHGRSVTLLERELVSRACPAAPNSATAPLSAARWPRCRWPTDARADWRAREGTTLSASTAKASRTVPAWARWSS